MNPFVRRWSDGSRKRITFPLGWLYYWSLWPAFGATLWAWVQPTPHPAVIAVACGLWLLLILHAVMIYPAMRQLRRQMRDGKLLASGSKNSIGNPLRYEWTVDAQGAAAAAASAADDKASQVVPRA
jgi:hypothetical protein